MQDGAIVDVITERITREYEDDKLVSEILEKRDGETLANKEKTCYDYDDKGTIIAQNDFQWLDDTWYQTYGELYTYNGYGNITGKVATTYTNTENAETGVIEEPSDVDTTIYVYDVWNQQTKETTNAGEEDEIASEATFDVLGRTTSVSDDGKTTEYTYDNIGNVITVTEDEEVTTYTYSDNGNLVSITNPDSTIAGYTYDTFGNLTGHNFNGYYFTYNTLASILAVSSESGQLVNYTYSDTIEQEVLTSNFGNGQSIEYEYNDDGEITAIKLGEETKYGYEYLETTDEYGDVTEEWTELTDYVSGLKKIIEEYKTTVNDLNGNFIYSVEDVSDNYAGKKITVGDTVYTLVTEENKDTFKTNGTTDFEKTYTYANDDLTNVETAGLTTSYSYNADKFISVLENTLNDISKAYGYIYDDNGNITTETVTTKDANGNVVATETIIYAYDDKEQLTSAETSTIKYEYTYDDRGNILSKAETDLTSNATVTDTYVYDETWKDKLISYNGQSITYDVAGNPLNYRGNTLTWSMGRQLASFGDISYTYNEDGIRTSKTSNGVITKFYLDGTRIIEQTDGTTTLHFFYDSNSEVIGFRYNGNNYIYVKNLMGDITGITDVNGNLVASYHYDPWGRVLDDELTVIGELNPFRYRSYYYDSDIQMYYLQSRYYDPVVGRFINLDDANYIGLRDSAVSYNPFAYCENNPENSSDPSGYCYYNAYGYWSHDNWEYKGNYKRKSDPYTKFKLLDKNQKIFVATICGEAIGCGINACKAVAWVIVNRIGVREWKKYKSAVSVIKNSGFDGYGSKQYNKAMKYLDNRNANGRDNKTYENIIAAVMPIYKNHRKKKFRKYYDISQGAVLFYSPYISAPKWNYSVLERVYISGVSSKDFIFYKYR